MCDVQEKKVKVAMQMFFLLFYRGRERETTAAGARKRCARVSQDNISPPGAFGFDLRLFVDLGSSLESTFFFVCSSPPNESNDIH